MQSAPRGALLAVWQRDTSVVPICHQTGRAQLKRLIAAVGKQHAVGGLTAASLALASLRVCNLPVARVSFNSAEAIRGLTMYDRVHLSWSTCHPLRPDFKETHTKKKSER